VSLLSSSLLFLSRHLTQIQILVGGPCGNRGWHLVCLESVRIRTKPLVMHCWPSTSPSRCSRVPTRSYMRISKAWTSGRPTSTLQCQLLRKLWRGWELEFGARSWSTCAQWSKSSAWRAPRHTRKSGHCEFVTHASKDMLPALANGMRTFKDSYVSFDVAWKFAATTNDDVIVCTQSSFYDLSTLGHLNLISPSLMAIILSGGEITARNTSTCMQ
jgi:hypothetical protein